MEQSVLETFLRCAERFCAWFESMPSARAREPERALQCQDALKARVLIAELYASGARLDEFQRSRQDRQYDPEENTLLDVGNIELRYVPGEIARGGQEILAQRLRCIPFQYYAELVADGFQMDLEGAQGVGDLYDDLRDIWIDMRRGLEEWRAGRPLEPLAE